VGTGSRLQNLARARPLQVDPRADA
jgi:hypothetical protein